MYKTLYEEALSQLKNNKTNSVSLSLKDLQLQNFDPLKIEKVVEKVKVYVQSTGPTSELNFESQEETLIFCETLKVLYLNEKDKINTKINEVNEKLREFDILQQEYDLIDNSLEDVEDSAGFETNEYDNGKIADDNVVTLDNQHGAYTNDDKVNINKKSNMRYSPVGEHLYNITSGMDDSNKFSIEKFISNEAPLSLYPNSNADDDIYKNSKINVPFYSNNKEITALQEGTRLPSNPGHLINTTTDYNTSNKRRNLADHFLNKKSTNDKNTANDNTSPEFRKPADARIQKPQVYQTDDAKKNPYARPSFLLNHTYQDYNYSSKNR